jgi:uncharacterized membrane protein HdeD (DUF308 family)
MTATDAAADTARSEAMSARLAQNWWALAARGLVAAIFGVIAFLLPGVTLLSLVLVFIAFMLIDGALTLVAALRAARRHDRWTLLALSGVASLAAAVLALLWPGLTVLAFVLLMAAWALISGGLLLAAAFRLRRDHGRWWLALGGILSIIGGVVLVAAPLLGALVLAWWIGAYAIVFGASQLMLAFTLRAHRSDPHVGAVHA